MIITPRLKTLGAHYNAVLRRQGFSKHNKHGYLGQQGGGPGRAASTLDKQTWVPEEQEETTHLSSDTRVLHNVDKYDDYKYYSEISMIQDTPTPLIINASNIFQSWIIENVRKIEGSVISTSREFYADEDLLQKLVKGSKDVYSLVQTRYGIVHYDGDTVIGVSEISVNKSIMNVDMVAMKTLNDSALNEVLDVYSGFTEIKSSLEWVYSDNGSSITVPLTNDKKPIEEFYPFLNGRTLEEYYDEYMASDASVLLLIGPPGTAKTSFIRGLIQHTQKSGLVTYDTGILSRDSFFAEFIDGSNTFLIMEDADTFLRSRKEENTMMFKFLNVSSGLITVTGKKMIFSTNLPSIKDVDEALIRPGRCHEVLSFDKLTSEQADKVRAKFGMKETGKAGTVAEILNQKDNPKQIGKRQTMGFI